MGSCWRGGGGEGLGGLSAGIPATHSPLLQGPWEPLEAPQSVRCAGLISEWLACGVQCWSRQA